MLSIGNRPAQVLFVNCKSMQYGNFLDLENLKTARRVKLVFKRTYLKEIGVLFCDSSM